MKRRHSSLFALLAVFAVALVLSGSADSAITLNGPAFTVMNTSETPPDGVWFRNSPRTADTNRVTGHGVYANERVQLRCFTFGEAVGRYANRLWYNVVDVSRPSNAGAENSGYLNAHYINDGTVANQIVAGVPDCAAPQEATPPPPPEINVFTVMNADIGVYYRNSPNWDDTPQIAGVGVYNGDRVRVHCGAFGTPVGPYNNTAWSYVTNLSRNVGDGWVNEHYISDGVPANAWPGTVPQCGPGIPGANGPPPPQPRGPATVTLAQGPAAPHGYRYAVRLAGFPANRDVSVTCYDRTGPFYAFLLRTNGAGTAFTQSYCYSADGPDHWVVADGVESNHVTWGSSGSAGGSPSNPRPGKPSVTPTQPQTPRTPSPAPEVCRSFSGDRISSSGAVWEALYRHGLNGNSRPVVIDWAFFSANPRFVAFAKNLNVNNNNGDGNNYYEPLWTEMGRALGNFSVLRTSEHCYWIHDLYDFSLYELPFWIQQTLGQLKTFEINASGKL